MFNGYGSTMHVRLSQVSWNASYYTWLRRAYIIVPYSFNLGSTVRNVHFKRHIIATLYCIQLPYTAMYNLTVSAYH